MISIECHRSGERCPGKREFDNRIEINRVRSGEIDVAIPFKLKMVKKNTTVDNKTFNVSVCKTLFIICGPSYIYMQMMTFESLLRIRGTMSPQELSRPKTPHWVRSNV